MIGRAVYPSAVSLFAAILSMLTTAAGADEAFRALFEEKYQAWVEYTTAKDLVSGNAGINSALFAIIELGPPAVPYMIEKMDENAFGLDFQLGFAVYQITKKRFDKGEHPEVRDSKSEARGYVKWWREQRAETPQRFAQYCATLEAGKSERDAEKAKAALTRIRELGVDALPLLIEKITQGEGDLIPAVS